MSPRAFLVSLPLPSSAPPFFRPSSASPLSRKSPNPQHRFLLLDPKPRTNNFPTPISCSSSPPPALPAMSTPVMKKRKRYRKSYPGENGGITEEMRFVAMRLRTESKVDDEETEQGSAGGEDDDEEKEETWNPTMDGYLKYLVDSKLVFDTLEGVVDQSEDVAYAYFRKTGLERSDALSKDLEQFTQLGFVASEPNSPGTSYAAYLKELSVSSAPSFLSHFYNIYFAHVTGGQAIGKEVSRRLLGGRDLEFYKWDGDALELLKDVREKLNKVGEHWSRDEKNRCLRETAKCFRMSGQIVRLIIL